MFKKKMLALPKSATMTGGKEKLELAVQLRGRDNNKKKETGCLELLSKSSGDLVLASHDLSNAKLTLASELEEKMRQIHEQQITMLELHDKAFSNTHLTMSKEKLELSRKLEKNMNDLAEAQKKLLELHVRSSQDSRLTTALEIQIEEKDVKLSASLREREKLERELSTIKAEVNSLKRTLNLERKDRCQLETEALKLIKDAKKKWESSNKDTISALKQTIENQTVRITELCTSNNEMSSKLQRLQGELETSTAELHKLRIYQHEYKESLAKTRELRRQSVAGVENKLEEIATRTHNQLAEIRMKLEMEISKNVELENELRNEKDGNHCKLSRLNVALEMTQSELKERDEELRSLRTMLPALEQEIETLRGQLKERSKQLETATSHETTIANLQAELETLRAEHKQVKQQLTITKSNLNETISNLKQSENIAFNLEKSILEKTHLEQKLQETEDKDDEKQRKVDGLEEFLNTLQQKLAKLEAENENLQKTTSNSRRKSLLPDDEKKTYEQRIQRLEKQLEKNREELATQKEQLRKTERDLWKKESEFEKENLHKRIAERKEKSLQDKFDKLQKEKNELSEELKKKEAEIDEKNKKILVQLDTAKESLQEATKDSTRNRLQAESAQRALTQANKQIEQLQSSNTTLQKELETLRKDKQSHEDRVALLTSKNKDLTKEITKLNEKRNSLQAKIDDFERKSKELQLNTEVLRETCVVLEEQLTDYERLTSDHETRENTLVQEKMRLQKDHDEIDKKLAELKIEKNEEKKKRTIAERAIEKLTGEIREIENKRDELREERDEYKKSIEELSHENESLTRRVSEMECDILQLERALEKAKSEAIIVKEESSQYLTRLHEYKDNNEELSLDLESAIEQGHDLQKRIRELESVLEDMRQFYQEHEVKAEGTRQQQTKLIDYLQLKLEEQSKKKKPLCEKIFKSKQKQSLLSSTAAAMQLNSNGMPVGYRELENQLSRERAKVKALTEQLLDLKAATVVSSPPKKYSNETTTVENNNKENISRSSHNIHHRFTSELSMRAGKCIACNVPIQFGKRVSICSYCQIMAHCKCLSLVPPNCGLPGGFAQHLAHGKNDQWRNSDESISTLSGSVQTLTIDEPDNPLIDTDNNNKNGNKNNKNSTMESWVKIPGRGKTSWDRKYLRLENNGYLCVYEHEPLENMSPIMKLELNGKSGFSINETIDQADVPGTAKSDLDFIFRVEEGSHNTCWPSSRLDIMSMNKIDKKAWLNALKSVKTSSLCTAKNSILSTILRLEKNRLDLNCVVEIESENEGVLLVCADEGLYSFRPSHNKVLTAIRGVKKVHQLSLYENIGLAIMIAGEDRKLVSCDLRQLKSNAMAADCSRPAVTTKNILNSTESCHLYQLQKNLLCAATSKSIILLKWKIDENGSGEFIAVKELETSDGSPCSCAIFTKDNLIVGCQKFYQIDLKNYTVDDFPEEDGSSVQAALAGVARLGIFPVAILNIGNLNDGRVELLLCYNEFGVFVDEHGRRTRAIDPTWNHLPFSFAFRKPYLFIVHFSSVEVIKLSPDAFKYESKAPEKTFIDLSNPRYLGLAGSRGIYIANVSSTLDIQRIDGAASIRSRMSESLSSLDSLGHNNNNADDDDDDDDSSSEFSFTPSLMETLDNPGKRVHFANLSNR